MLKTTQLLFTVQRALDMHEAQTPLELLQAHALHTCLLECELSLLCSTQNAPGEHLRSRSSMHHCDMLCPALGRKHIGESMLNDGHSFLSDSCLDGHCNSAAEPSAIRSGASVSITCDADVIIPGLSQASAQQVEDASAASFGGEILCDPVPLAHSAHDSNRVFVVESSAAEPSTNPSGASVSVTCDADVIIIPGLSQASAQQVEEASAASFGGEILCDPVPLAHSAHYSNRVFVVESAAYDFQDGHLSVAHVQAACALEMIAACPPYPPEDIATWRLMSVKALSEHAHAFALAACAPLPCAQVVLPIHTNPCDHHEILEQECNSKDSNDNVDEATCDNKNYDSDRDSIPDMMHSSESELDVAGGRTPQDEDSADSESDGDAASDGFAASCGGGI